MTMSNMISNAELAIVTVVFQSNPKVVASEDNITADMLQDIYQRDLSFRKKVEGALSVKMVPLERIQDIFTLDTFNKVALSLNIARNEKVIYYGYKPTIKQNTNLY